MVPKLGTDKVLLPRVTVGASQMIGANSLAMPFSPEDGVGTPFTVKSQFFSALFGYGGNIYIGQSVFYTDVNW